MAAITIKSNISPSRLKPLLSLQRLYSTLLNVEPKYQYHNDSDCDLISKPGAIDVSKWEKLDSRSLGISRMMVPPPSYIVLKILKNTGFEAYLVGGCVRDLILRRTPKDFDVITTADLNQIKKQFHRCVIVGHWFPICRVHIKGSVVEVSSFQTLAQHAEEKEKFLVSQMPSGCDQLDLVRWKNSMHRDFTINSLFFDPFACKIYDYNNGMRDLMELKLQTLVPADLSFTEDCARILRGLRIAARLGLSLSKEIKIAISKNHSSILNLGQSRLMMELNYMLSFGAAESSLSLLHKFHLLEILLPFQAAYISQQATRSGQSSMMLMKLFFHLDKLVTCDRPSNSCLWIALLAFHMALVNYPQHPTVVVTFASILYHQNWDEGLQFARQCDRAPVSFTPEILEPTGFISDDELAEKVKHLALLVLESVNVLVDTDSLHKTMAKFPGFPCSGVVFISNTTGQSAAQIFNVLAHKVESYKKGRTSFQIDYDLLGKRDSSETRFALGKIILNAVGCGVDQDTETIKDNYHSPSSKESGHDMDKNHPLTPSNSDLQQGGAPGKQNVISKLSSIMQNSGKENAAVEKTLEDCSARKPEELGVGQSSMQQVIAMLESSHIDKKRSPSQLESQKKEEKLEDYTGMDGKHLSSRSNSKLLQGHPNKQKLIAKISSIIRNSNKQKAAIDEKLVVIADRTLLEQEGEEVTSEVYAEALGNSSDPKTEDSMEINVTDKLKNRIQSEEDETGTSAFELWAIQTNCKNAIEEARDSPADMKKLNQFLVDFVEEQVQRKKTKQLGRSSLVASSLDTSQVECTPQISVQDPAELFNTNTKQFEPSCLVVSSIGTSQVEHIPQICVQDLAVETNLKQLEASTLVAPQACVQDHAESFKTKEQPEKADKIKSSGDVSTSSPRKKQRTCSYCKELGHNRLGCPKRKIEEASLRVNNEST